MAGLYIHIPFCRKACHFCNFHFSTSLKQKDRMLQALLKEIDIRKDELGRKEVNSIYLGGGTPSVLNKQELKQLFSKLEEHFQWTAEAEITLEANPDDLTEKFLNDLQASPVNRLSIGLQSLNESQLKWMNRSHTAEQSIQVIEKVKAFDFQNLTVDWIYGYPGLSEDQLLQQLNWMKEHSIPHFSAYALTIEPNTVLAHRLKTGKEPEWDDNLSARHFDLVMDWASENGYEHYEISNFALPAHRAKHNSSYWNNEPYLGLGPSAHSYDGKVRRWNVANNAAYMKALEDDKINFEQELLRPKDHYNEWVMTQLRLKEGISLATLQERFPQFQSHFKKALGKSGIQPLITNKENHIRLKTEGKHFADRVAAHFFL